MIIIINIISLSIHIYIYMFISLSLYIYKATLNKAQGRSADHRGAGVVVHSPLDTKVLGIAS